MKNQLVSLLEIIKLAEDEKTSEKYIRYICGLDSTKEYRHQEILDIKNLIDCLNCNSENFDGFIYNYIVPQLNKEFDLIKITELDCINIELKSCHIDEQKIRNQLIQNKYYLKMLGRENICLFTYISNENKLYQLIEEELFAVSFAVLINALDNKNGQWLDLDDVYTTKNILVSPLNDTKKFLDGKYILTEHQRNIEIQIENYIETNATNYGFAGLTGGPGTGKTLLIYDLTKKLSLSKRILLVHSGILCDGHAQLNEALDNVKIISAKDLRLREIKDVDIVVVDESHRLYENILEKIERWVKKAKAICLFSYDNNQKLSKAEQERKTSEIIDSLCGKNIYKLTNKIRTNKELALFITCLFDLTKYREEYVFNNVKIIYEPNQLQAVTMAKKFDFENEYTYITYTPSFYDDALDYQKTDRNTHAVIGQEFENVCMIIDNNFYYENKKLQAVTHPNPDYLFTKLLYQGLTRVRSKLAIIITEKSILENVLLMFK